MIQSSASDVLLCAAHEGAYAIAIGREAALELRNFSGAIRVRTAAVGGTHFVEMRSPLALMARREAR